MFLPAKMTKVTAVVLDDYKDSLIAELHELGTLEIKDITEEIEEGSLVSPAKADERVADILPLLTRTNRLLETLEHIKKKPHGLFAEPEEPIDIEDIAKLRSESISMLEEVEGSVKTLEDSLAGIDRDIEEYSSAIETLDKFKEFDFNLRYVGESTYLFVACGEVSTEVLDALATELKSLDTLLLSERKERRSPVVVAGLKADKTRIYETLKGYGFEEFTLPKEDGTPREIIEEYTKKISDREDRRGDLVSKLEKLSDENLQKLLVLKELLQIEGERAGITKRFAKTTRTFVVEGFAPEKKSKALLEALQERTKGYAIIRLEEPTEPEEAIPVLLDNPGFVKPFEILTKTFGMPSYTEMDPTFMMALWFPLFFGIMLTDAAYGIMLLALSFFLYTHFTGALRDISMILLISSVFTIVLGILFGSIFGDFFQRFFGFQFGVFDMLVKAEVALILAIIVGMLHLNIGLAMGIKRKLEIKAYEKLLYEHIWILTLEIGCILILLSKARYLPTFNLGLLFIGGSILILIKGDGVLGVMRIPSFFGAVLSYARLLALGLATTGVAMAVNIMSEMLGKSTLGVILAILLLVVGHVFNLVINAFGAFIHAMRLHYLEFFGMFYEAKGKIFLPFEAKRKYTKIGLRR
ncbi:MAG: V-type ATP synthase subunit I [Candidatus Hydrothermarchaeales archaeon]